MFYTKKENIVNSKNSTQLFFQELLFCNMLIEENSINDNFLRFFNEYN